MNIDHDRLRNIFSTLKLPVDGNNQPCIVSLALTFEEPDFETILLNLSARGERFFYLEQSSLKQVIFGFTVLKNLVTSISGNALIKNEIAALQKNWVTNFTELGINSVPFVLGGLKFSSGDENNMWEDFGGNDWFIPRYLFLKRNSRNYVIFNFMWNESTGIDISKAINDFLSLSEKKDNPGPESKAHYTSENVIDPDDFSNWTAKMNTVLSKISNGEIVKAVLSRKVELRISGCPSLYKIFKGLAQDYPACYVFGYGAGSSVFLGASPEKLARISKGQLETDALAGSIPRGNNPAEDETLGTELLKSKKNLAEHNAVLDFITNALKEFSTRVEHKEIPGLKKLSNIQHLWTPVTAFLKENYSVIDVIGALHPTPAVSGVPQKTAMELIREVEDYDRGLYAGIIGWFNFEDEGEFCVGIRSALLKNKTVHAFAGCGIVSGSDILSEYREAELKLQPILSIFKNEKIY